jgi:hypothetical protein
MLTIQLRINKFDIEEGGEGSSTYYLFYKNIYIRRQGVAQRYKEYRPGIPFAPIWLYEKMYLPLCESVISALSFFRRVII